MLTRTSTRSYVRFGLNWSSKTSRASITPCCIHTTQTATPLLFCRQFSGLTPYSGGNGGNNGLTNPSKTSERAPLSPSQSGLLPNLFNSSSRPQGRWMPLKQSEKQDFNLRETRLRSHTRHAPSPAKYQQHDPTAHAQRAAKAAQARMYIHSTLSLLNYIYTPSYTYMYIELCNLV